MTASQARRHKEGRAKLDERLTAVRKSALQPAPRLTGSEWADRYGVLSKEYSSATGRIKLHGYQRELLDAMTDPSVRQVTICKSARIGYTVLMTFAIAYYCAADPSPVLVVLPTERDAAKYSARNLKPVMRDVGPMAAIANQARKGDTQDTIFDKYFANSATVTIRNAASDDAFRAHTTKLNVADELDAGAWDASGRQANKVKLLRKRGESFFDSKLLLGSTPLLKGESRICAEFEKGDQRRFNVPCPSCGGYQYFKWGGPDCDYGIKWSTNDDGQVDDAWYVCEHCHDRIDETHKVWMDRHGEWRPTATPQTPGHRSYHIWTANSFHPNATWKHLAQEWVEACKNPHSDLQQFVNETLGEPWEDTGGKKVDPESLAATRVIPYAAEVPDGVLYLTAGVDVQSGENARLEYEIVGWCAGERSYQITYGVIDRDPGTPEAWEELDEVLLRKWRDVHGREFAVQAACVDSGGHFTAEAYDFCRKRRSRRVFAIKGASTAKGQRKSTIWPKKPGKGKGGAEVFNICTQSAKDRISRMLNVEEPGPGYMQFPAGTTEAYFQGLTAERKVYERVGGRLVNYWKHVGSTPNEPLDARVYAYAAVHALKSFGLSWDLDRIAQKGPVASAPGAGGSESEKPAAPEQPQAQQSNTAQRRPRRRIERSSFMSRG